MTACCVTLDWFQPFTFCKIESSSYASSVNSRPFEIRPKEDGTPVNNVQLMDKNAQSRQKVSWTEMAKRDRNTKSG